MIRQVFMAATVLALVLLIMVTPRFVGHEEDIGSLPRLILQHAENETVVLLTSASGTYLFANLSLLVRYAVNDSVFQDVWRERALALEARWPDGSADGLRVNATAIDRTGRVYEHGVVVSVRTELGEDVLYLQRPEDAQPQRFPEDALPYVAALARREAR